LGVAEEHHHHLALEVGQGARLAGVVGQGEVLGVVQPGDIGIVELQFRLGRPAGRQQRRAASQQQRRKESFHGNQKLRNRK
jgi:hypothetical protein